MKYLDLDKKEKYAEILNREYEGIAPLVNFSIYSQSFIHLDDV